MKTQNEIANKCNYILPRIERIQLDNEISLALESTLEPPIGPNESQATQTLSSNPFKDDLT